MYISKYTKSSDSRREPFNNGFIERYIINDTEIAIIINTTVLVI